MPATTLAIPSPTAIATMPPFSNTRWLVLDTETTGLDPKEDRICELAAVMVPGMEVIADTLLNPGRPIPPAASAIHHITDAHVADMPTLGECRFSAKFDCVVAHNAEFDRGFLPMIKKPWLCTKRLAMHVLPDSEKYSNQFLRYDLKLEVPECEGIAAHRALADCFVTARVMLYLLDHLPPEAPADLDGLIAWAESPVLQKVCQFPKHRGTPWADVPRDYLQWMQRSMTDMDADLAHTVNFYLGGR